MHQRRLTLGQECLVTIIGSSGDVVLDAAFAMVRWVSVRAERDCPIGLEYLDKRAKAY